MGIKSWLLKKLDAVPKEDYDNAILEQTDVRAQMYKYRDKVEELEKKLNGDAPVVVKQQFEPIETIRCDFAMDNNFAITYPEYAESYADQIIERLVFELADNMMKNGYVKFDIIDSQMRCPIPVVRATARCVKYPPQDIKVQMKTIAERIEHHGT